MKKKLLLSILACAIVLSLSACGDSGNEKPENQTATTDSAEQEEELSVSDFEYETDSATGGVKITAYIGEDSEVTIPSEIGGNSVTSIDKNAFERCYSFESVTIPDSVTIIGSEAFKHCGNLKSVVLPDSISKIAMGTFYGCKSLKEIVIPDSVTSIGMGAFRDCSNLKSITIPDSVTEIGGGAFYGCDKLSNVDASFDIRFRIENDITGGKIFDGIVNG